MGIYIGIAVGVLLIAGVIVFMMRSNDGLPDEAEPPRRTGRSSEDTARKTASAKQEQREVERVSSNDADDADEAEEPDEAEEADDADDADDAEEPDGAEEADAAADDADDADDDDAEEADDADDADEAETPDDSSAEAPAARTRKPRAAPSEEDVRALRRGLASTRGGFIARLAKLFGKKAEIDQELLDEVQELLITADIGVATSERILESLKSRIERGELEGNEKVWAALREDALDILEAPEGTLSLSGPPALIIVVGVNGVGKTTTIGKLASRFKDDGKTVVLAAGDTFRAAAVLQLEVWGRKVGCEVVKGKTRADPASVIFDAVKKAEAEGADIVIADTAGRLHTKSNLMEELKKVVRTAEKALGRSVDEIVLVLDSTTGQNAIQQAQLFKDAIDVSGIALTKLDGTAKGGVILGIVDQHKLPIYFVGIGERVEDLREFEPVAFVEALFAKPEDSAAA